MAGECRQNTRRIVLEIKRCHVMCYKDTYPEELGEDTKQIFIFLSESQMKKRK